MVWKIAAQKPFLEQLWWQTGWFCCQGVRSPGRACNSMFTSNAWKLAFCSHFCGHQPEYLPGALLFQAVTEASRAGKKRRLNSISATLQNQTWKRGEKQHTSFSVPLITTSKHYLWVSATKVAFLDGGIRNVKSFYEVQVLYKGKMDASVVNTGLASGGIGGEKTVWGRHQDVHVSWQQVLPWMACVSTGSY